MDAITQKNEESGRITYKCPRCKHKLVYFSGVEAGNEYTYCPNCVDAAYSLDGQKLASLY